MSTFAISHEILTIRGAQPTLTVHPSAGNAADRGVRISDEHILPARVTELIASAQATLADFLRIDGEKFQRFIQTSPSSGQFHYGEAVLALGPDASPTTVAQCRDVALQFCRLIGSANSEAAQTTIDAPTTSPEAEAEREPLRHEDLRQATFLGMRIPVPLDLLVPGHASLRIQKRLQRSPSRGTSDVVHEVLAEFCSVTVGAKQTTLGISGRSLLDGQSFARKPILLARSDLPLIGAALCDLKTQLRLWINVHILDEGRAKPRRTNTLIKLEFDVTENAEPPAAAIPPARTEDEPFQVQVTHQGDSIDCATPETWLCIADESHTSAPQEAIHPSFETGMVDASTEATANTAAAFQPPALIGKPPSLYSGGA